MFAKVRINLVSDGNKFLGFIVSSQRVHANEQKVASIRIWPTTTNASEVRSFHGLGSFYKKNCERFKYYCCTSQ